MKGLNKVTFKDLNNNIKFLNKDIIKGLNKVIIKDLNYDIKGLNKDIIKGLNYDIKVLN